MREVSSVRDELLNRIDDVERNVDGVNSHLHDTINSEVASLTRKIEELDRTFTSIIDNLEEEVYNSQDRFFESCRSGRTRLLQDKKRN
jgi:hypothetical protein